MSDYLTNLVSRSTERGNLLAPRLPSAFESQTSEVQSQSLESHDESTLTLAQLQQPEQRVRQAPESKSLDLQDDAQQVVPAHQEIELLGELNVIEDLRDDELVRAKAEVEPQGEHPAGLPAQTASPHATEAMNDSHATALETRSSVLDQSQRLNNDKTTRVRTRQPHTRQPSKTSRQIRVTDRRSNFALPHEVLRDVTRNEVIDLEAKETLADEHAAQPTKAKRLRLTGHASIARERELRASLPMDQLLERPPSEISGSSNDLSSTYSTEPVINVTIGRIEVKATQSSTPDKRGSQRSPVMPLEEYLKLQRRGGSR